MKYASVEEHIGVGVFVDPTAEFINVEKLYLGDHTYIGPGVRIIGGSFVTGDYSKIHNNCYVYSKNSIVLGHNTWIGQGTHLDGTGGIAAGDFLGVGINSALYSHIRHGDINEGCQFDSNSFLEIGHDVWFVGMCLVSPVVAHSKSMAFLGSVITKDLKENSVYGGNPAKDITDKVGKPWRDISVDEKAEKMNLYLDEFGKLNPGWERDRFRVVDTFSSKEDGVIEYNVATREYLKTNTVDEVQFNKWVFPYKAKFRPKDGKLPYFLSSNKNLKFC